MTHSFVAEHQLRAHPQALSFVQPSNGNSFAAPWAFAVASLSSAVVASVLYVTMYPSVSGGDVGELVLTTCNKSVAHPPGYPIFSMLGAAFARLVTSGTWAWRVHLLSVIEAALAALLMVLLTRNITHNHSAGTKSCGVSVSAGI